ncbi:MAG: Sec-independent protein translocase protein TatB [bacterium]
MLDIGGLELLLIAVVALLVIGPERMPEALRTLGLWLGRLRRSFTSVKNEIEKEIGMDEVRRQLHNESVMEQMKRIEEEVQNSISPETNESHPPQADVQDSKAEEQTPEPVEDAPAPPAPRSEAELEAEHARRKQQTSADKG